jgi:hypothetical protein
MSFQFAYMKIEGISPGYDNVVQADNDLWKDPVFWTLLQLYRSELISRSPYDILYKEAPFELCPLAEPIENIVNSMTARHKVLHSQMNEALDSQDFDSFKSTII